MSEYVTDPSLLEKLNGSSEYVTDPALLEKLNSGKKPGFVDTLKGMSVEDWRKNSAASPTLDMLQSIMPGGTEEQYQAATKRVKEKGDQIVGGIANVIQNPIEAATNVYKAITTNPGNTMGEMVKGAIYDPQFAMLPGTGDAAMAAGKATVNAGKAVTKPVTNFGKGFYQGVTNPTYNEATSAMIPLRETYTPVAAAERFMGNLPTPQNRFTANPPNVPPQTLEQLQSQARPTSELMTNPIDKFAKATAPVSPEGYPLVPLQGRGMEAWGERVGRGIRTNPGQALAEAAITGLTGVPVKTISQGVSELAARHLANKTGFNPEFPAAVQAAQGRAGIQANMPTQQALPYNPTPGPVNPATLYGTTTGEVGLTPQAATSEALANKYKPQPTQTPKQMSMDLAASKLQPVAPAINPQQQAILDQIRARGQQPAPTPTPTQAPTVGPVVPEGFTPSAPMSGTPTDMATRLAKLKTDLESQGHTVESPKITSKDVAEQTKMAAESAAQARGHILKEWVNGNRLAQGETLDLSKGAYGAANNRTTKQAERLMKAGIDEIPVVEGATNKQVIDALHGYIEKSKPELFKAKRGPSKKGPSNVSKMLTEDTSSSGKYSSKEEFEKAGLFSTLKEEAHTGSYPQGDKIIHVEEINYGNLPKDVTSTWEQTKTYATDKNGNRVPIGKEWTEADPEPLTSQLKKRFKRD